MSDAEQLGQRLRAAREAKELSIEETEQATRIRAKFLEALEAGDYASMTPVQAQGFMRNYTRFLGLDYELLIAELDDDKGPFRRRRRGQLPLPTNTIARPTQPGPVPNANGPRPARQRPVRRSRGVFSTLLIVVLAGVIVVGLIFGVTSFLNQWAESETQPSPTVDVAPSLTADESGDMVGDDMSTGELTAEDGGLLAGDETLAPADTAVTDVAPAQGDSTSEYTPPLLTGTSVNVVIEVVQRTFVRIEVDGEVLYEDFANEGEILNYTGQTSVGVRANNAAGLNLTVNNLPQGIVGARGELFDQTFTLNGAAPPGGDTSALPSDGLPSGDTSLPSGAPESPTAALQTSPTEAAFLTPTPGAPTATIPLDPGDGSVFDSVTITLEVSDASATPTPTLTPSLTVVAPSATATVIATATAPASATSMPAITPTPTLTATEPAAADTTVPVTAAPSATATSTPSVTPSATPSATPTVTASPTASSTATVTWTPSPTLTWTPSPTWSATPSLTPTATPFLPPRLTRTPSPVPKQ